MNKKNKSNLKKLRKMKKLVPELFTEEFLEKTIAEAKKEMLDKDNKDNK